MTKLKSNPPVGEGKKRKWLIIGRHNNWVKGCRITESVKDDEPKYRRFIATIEGWRDFKIYEGYMLNNEMIVKAIIKRVSSIKERIKNGDDSVFKEKVKIMSIK